MGANYVFQTFDIPKFNSFGATFCSRVFFI